MTKICPLYDERDALRGIVDQLRPELVPTLDADQGARPATPGSCWSAIRSCCPRAVTAPRLPRFRPQDRATFRAINLRLRYADARLRPGQPASSSSTSTGVSIGHDVCSRHPWVQGRVGSSHRGAALHPLPSGQAALARLIEATLRRDPPTTGEDS